MNNKTIQVSKTKEIAELMQQIDEANKSPAFRKAAKRFIKQQTS